MFRGRSILELGTGTGVLGIYLKKLGMEVCTSDYKDDEIEPNLRKNCELNEV